jgi:hypothetical protein
MNGSTLETKRLRGGLLDRIAVGMAVVCGIHCLVTPVLLVVLPILGTTFWVDEDFHLWMLFLVIPTTCLALFSGCRRHKDRWVLAVGVLGLGILLGAFTVERLAQRDLVPGVVAPAEEGIVSANAQSAAFPGSTAAHVAGGGCCALHPANAETAGAEFAAPGGIAPHALLNALGGFFLVVGHSRNFLLCRKTACHH